MFKPPASSGIRLSSAEKLYSVEQDKTRPPAETVTWARERFSEMGADILKETKRIDTGRLDIPVYLSLCGPSATLLTSTAKQMGKGASPAQAEASALMELAERFSFFHFMGHTDFPLLTLDQASGMAGGRTMDFSQVPHSLYHPNDDLERAKAVFDLLPQTWAWARNLTAKREEFIPLGWFYAINEYNGPAGGNCIEEAVLQSLCEVVERHVSALVWNERRPTPAIDPDSIDDPVARELIDKFEGAGIEVYLKDFTCDMGIPSVGALCWDPATFGHKSEIVYTAGTATSPAKALIRALTEVAQLAGDFETFSNYKVSALPKFSDMDAAEYVTRAAGTVALSDLPDVGDNDLQREVNSCVEALDRRGFSVYHLNVTHPELKVPAVYCIIPGAHFAKRTTGTDVIFHASKLASQLPDSRLALDVLADMSAAAGGGPVSYYLPFFRALALLEEERPAAALEELDAALALDPPPEDLSSVHTQRGVALKDMECYPEALEALQTAAGFPDPHHEVFNLMGFCHFMLQEYEQAMEAFGRAIEIEPGQAINYANIGSCLRELGQIDEACRMYQSALDLDSSIEFARENLERLGKG